MNKAEKKCPINREFSCDNNCAWYIMTDTFSEKGQCVAFRMLVNLEQITKGINNFPRK
ncbi:MAG: hypothetical protein PHX78_07045 [bacterium]|nr:hypothetical protein [bacterium]